MKFTLSSIYVLALTLLMILTLVVEASQKTQTDLIVLFNPGLGRLVHSGFNSTTDRVWVYETPTIRASSMRSPTPSVTNTRTPTRTSTPTPRPKFTGLFLPLIFTPPIDLSIIGLEVTQAVQTANHDVPLVENRMTQVRIYARTSGTHPESQVSLSIAASRGGAPLPESPLLIGPTSISPAPSQAEYDSSVNALLPTAWLSGDVTLVVTVDSNASVQEIHEDNNTASIALSFNPVPPLELMIVPINYIHTPTGLFLPAPTSDTISDYVMRTYPLHAINVSLHAPVNYEGNLSEAHEWQQLLDEITDIKSSEDAPDEQVYYGLISIRDQSGQLAFVPETAGYAWYDERVSVGLDDDNYHGGGPIAAHEIGHNLGRRHAPCGGASQIDPDYPYSEGSIGHYGLDIAQNRVLSPDTNKDFMSYCNFEWVSDYTYRALYDDQRTHGARKNTSSATESLLIRASFDSLGSPTLHPLYALSTRPTEAPSSSDYIIELLSATGQVLASHPVKIYEAEEASVKAQSIHAVVPRPLRQVTKVRLLESGTSVAERVLTSAPSTRLSASIVEQTASRLILRWGTPAIPALVRYTTDEGNSWTTLGIDVSGGELHLDPRTLRGGQGYFEITLADHATWASTEVALPTALPDTTPSAWITGPTTARVGEPLMLFAHGYDREDGVLTTTKWAIDGVPIEGTQTLQLDKLDVGKHTITVTTRDSSNHVISTTHSIEITN